MTKTYPTTTNSKSFPWTKFTKTGRKINQNTQFADELEQQKYQHQLAKDDQSFNLNQDKHQYKIETNNTKYQQKMDINEELHEQKRI
jgi:hypothetical protein